MGIIDELELARVRPWEALLDAAAAGRQLAEDELGLLDEEAVLVALRRGLADRRAAGRRLWAIADEARWVASKTA